MQNAKREGRWVPFRVARLVVIRITLGEIKVLVQPHALRHNQELNLTSILIIQGHYTWIHACTHARTHARTHTHTHTHTHTMHTHEHTLTSPDSQST